MGKVRQSSLKRIAEEVIKQDEENFSDSFKKNKENLKKLKIIRSKTTRNRIAGYMVKVVQNKAF